MAEEIKKMERLMKETVEGWQEMEGKDKAVCVIDESCEKWKGTKGS